MSWLLQGDWRNALVVMLAVVIVAVVALALNRRLSVDWKRGRARLGDKEHTDVSVAQGATIEEAEIGQIAGVEITGGLAPGKVSVVDNSKITHAKIDKILGVGQSAEQVRPTRKS